MVTGGRHQRHLAEEGCTGSEEIIIPITVVPFATNEITVHERYIAVEIANEVLHVRPVITGVSVNIADGKDTESCAGFGRRFCAAHFIKAASGRSSDGEVITGVRLQVGKRNHMYKPFIGYIPTGVGLYLLVEVIGISAVQDERVGRFYLIIHLPNDLDRVSGRRHGIRLFIGYVGFAAGIVIIRGDTPTRIAKRAVIRSSKDSRAVGIELEIAVLRIDEIGITGQTVRLRTTCSHFYRGIERDTVMHIGVGTIHRKTIGILVLCGIHENTIGDMRVIEVG